MSLGFPLPTDVLFSLLFGFRCISLLQLGLPQKQIVLEQILRR